MDVILLSLVGGAAHRGWQRGTIRSLSDLAAVLLGLILSFITFPMVGDFLHFTLGFPAAASYMLSSWAALLAVICVFAWLENRQASQPGKSVREEDEAGARPMSIDELQAANLGLGEFGPRTVPAEEGEAALGRQRNKQAYPATLDHAGGALLGATAGAGLAAMVMLQAAFIPTGVGGALLLTPSTSFLYRPLAPVRAPLARWMWVRLLEDGETGRFVARLHERRTRLARIAKYFHHKVAWAFFRDPYLRRRAVYGEWEILAKDRRIARLLDSKAGRYVSGYFLQDDPTKKLKPAEERLLTAVRIVRHIRKTPRARDLLFGAQIETLFQDRRLYDFLWGEALGKLAIGDDYDPTPIDDPRLLRYAESLKKQQDARLKTE